MSHHILHILQHGALLGKERGFITSKVNGQAEKRLPHADIRAVIIAARGVTLTSSFISAILEADGIVLHCDEHYQPCGITAPLPRIVNTEAFLHQSSQPLRLNARLWHVMLKGKTVNQVRVLQSRQQSSPLLDSSVLAKKIDEANCARQYWQLYFPSIGWGGSKRDRKQESPPNRMLNYGYAVLAALCHRSLVIHGLSPLLGVHHKPRYGAHPLVYDIMEPYRPVVDLMLAQFMIRQDASMASWCKHIGSHLRETRVRHNKFTLKLMDAIDESASSLARSYAAKSYKLFWVPELEAA